MYRLSFAACAAACLACDLLPSTVVAQSNYTWTTGVSGDWNSTGWTLSGTQNVGPPPAAANATISVGGMNGNSYTVTVDDAETINNLTLQSTNAVLSIATGGTLTVNGAFNLNTGQINNSAGGLTLNGAFNWGGGTISGGTVTATNGGTVTGGTVNGASVVLSAGTYLWTTGNIAITAGSLTVGANATLTTNANSNFQTSGIGTIQNNGMIAKTGGNGGSQIPAGITLTNAGTLQVTSGNWDIKGAIINTGTLDIESAGEDFVDGGSITLNTGSILTGNGLIDVNQTGGALTVNTAVSFPGSLTYVRGLVNGTSTMTVSGAFDFALFDSNSLTGVTINAAGGGSWTGGGTPRIGTGTVNVTGGTVTWSGQNIVFTDSGLLTVANGASLMLADDSSILVTGGSPVITINGLFEKSGGTGHSTISAGIALSTQGMGVLDIEAATLILNATTTNNGAIKVGTGTLNLNQVISYSGTGTLNITSSGMLSVAVGTNNTQIISSGTFTNSGTVQVTSGTLQITSGANISNYALATSTLSGGIWQATNATLDFGGRVIGTIASGTSVELSGTNAAVTGLAGLTQNNGKLRIYNGATVTPSATLNNAGTIEVSGTLGDYLNVQSGGILTGKGTVNGAVTLQSGGSIIPGPGPYAANGIGVLTVGNSSWSGGSNYVWQLNSWLTTASAGNTSNGFGQIVGLNGSTLSFAGASSANPITISITSLNGSTAGLIPNYNASTSRSWVIADFSNGNSSGGIQGFSANLFALDTSAFANAPGITQFSLSTSANSNQLILNYTPVPEPASTGLLAALMLGGIAAAYRRLTIHSSIRSA